MKALITAAILSTFCLSACGTSQAYLAALERHGTTFTVPKDSSVDVWYRGVTWIARRNATTRLEGSHRLEGDDPRAGTTWVVAREELRDSARFVISFETMLGMTADQVRQMNDARALAYFMHYAMTADNWRD